MPGEFITCPNCQGWPSCETGMICLTCGDDGQVWDEYPDDYEEGFDAGEWNNALPANPGPAVQQRTGETK